MKNDMIYQPVMICTEENYLKTYQDVRKANIEHLEKIEQKAIAQGSLLYRFLYEGVADGKAIYQIIKVNKTTVRVRLCILDGLYDDYVVPQWGDEATIDREYAEQNILRQDMWRKFIAERKA